MDTEDPEEEALKDFEELENRNVLPLAALGFDLACSRF